MLMIAPMILSGAHDARAGVIVRKIVREKTGQCKIVQDNASAGHTDIAQRGRQAVIGIMR